MESALRALLTSYAPLTSLVGGSSTPRIVWNHLPQATTRPAVVLFKVTGAEGLTHGGPDGLSGNIVQVDIQALTVTSMWAIRDAIIAKLHGYSDATFGLIRHDSERQSAEELAGAGSLIHRASLDFTVWADA
jgi:hypothetical protein